MDLDIWRVWGWFCFALFFFLLCFFFVSIPEFVFMKAK